MLVFHSGTTGKSLPCFPNSLFTPLPWQKSHKPGKQKDSFPGHWMGVQTSRRCSPPAFPSSPPGLPLLQPLVEPISLGQGGLPRCVCTGTILSPLPPHTCYHRNTERRDCLASTFITSHFVFHFISDTDVIRKAPWQKPEAVLHQVSRSSEERLLLPSLEQSYGEGTTLSQRFFWGKGACLVHLDCCGNSYQAGTLAQLHLIGTNQIATLSEFCVMASPK